MSMDHMVRFPVAKVYSPGIQSPKKGWDMKSLLTMAIVIFSLSVFLPASKVVWATSDPRPFWTKKSSFIIGDELFAVGVASQSSTREKGRQQAFSHGVLEIMNFAQIPDLSGLVIETQMIFEEPNVDHTITVYRLLKVSLPDLMQIKKERNNSDDQGWESPRIREAMKRLRALRQDQMPHIFPLDLR